MTTVRFSKKQLAEFSRSLHSRCEHRIGALLIDSFPEASRMPRDQLDAMVHRGCEKAHHYGLVSERAAALVVLVSWLHGEDFDTRLPGMSDWLLNSQNSSAEKLSLLSRYLQPAAATDTTGQRR